MMVAKHFVHVQYSQNSCIERIAKVCNNRKRVGAMERDEQKFQINIF